MPCLSAFIFETARPSGVFGPVDFCALAWLAAICFKDIFLPITSSPSSLRKHSQSKSRERIDPLVPRPNAGRVFKEHGLGIILQGGEFEEAADRRRWLSG